MTRPAPTMVGERLASAFGLVLLLLISTYVLASLAPYRGFAGVCITALATLSATVALISAPARTSQVVWAWRLSAVAVAFAIVGAATDTRAMFAIAAVIAMAMLAAGAAALLVAVLTEQRVGFRTILGAVSVYITLGLLFAFLYLAVDRFAATPFFAIGTHVQNGDYLYFSITTLTTTGFGDLVPAGQPGKMFAAMEMLFGQVFLVTLIAGLVSLWRPGEWLRRKQDGTT